MLIAAIVSSIYELNTRSIFDLERMEGVLKTVLASNVPPEVWDQANSEILQRNVIRRNVEIRLRLRRDTSLPDHQTVLRMEVSYDLHGLKPQPLKYTLKNGLNLHMQSGNGALPRFESVTVGTNVYKDEALSEIVKDDFVTLEDINVGPKDGPPVRVVVERTEITNTPGDYSIVFTELTQGIRLYFDELPAGIEADANMGSDKGLSKVLPIGHKIWYFDGVMFPGQGLSVRFKKSLNKQSTTP